MLHVLARPVLWPGLTIIYFMLMLVRLWISFATVKRMLGTCNTHTLMFILLVTLSRLTLWLTFFRQHRLILDAIFWSSMVQQSICYHTLYFGTTQVHSAIHVYMCICTHVHSNLYYTVFPRIDTRAFFHEE